MTNADATFEFARAAFLRGVACYQAQRFQEAEREFEAALALVPGRPSTLTNLGATRLKLGRAEDALDLLDEALAREPDNAEALGHRGTARAELGQLELALRDLDRAVALAPQVGHAWTLRGSVLRDLGQLEASAESFRQALARGADPELTRYYLAGVTQAGAPDSAPRPYVQALFDGYAREFDEQLVRTLRYDAPDRLVAGLRRMRPRFGRALDLGCGTGLCGRQLRPMVDRLEGVDLSGGMLTRARALGVYDELVQADLTGFLAAAPTGCDLVIAADVFIYVGALDDVFREVARLLVPGGLFCFSVESASEAEGLALRPSLRYAHSEGYLRGLCAAHGFEVAAQENAPIREDQGQPIPGLYFWLRRLP